jgi:putative salt-induced outer membrane protein
MNPLFLVLALAAHAQEPAKTKPWKGSVEVSLAAANGNTKSSTFASKDRFEYAAGPMLTELEAGLLRATNKAQVSAEQYFLSEKVGYKWDAKDYVFEKLRWDKDRLAGVNNRYDFTLGVGRKFLDTPVNRLHAELGAGRVWEQRVSPAPANDFTAGRAYTRYERSLTKTSTCAQDLEYLHSFDKPRDYRLKTETSVTADVATGLSLKASFVWKRVGSPPPGFIKDDTLLSTALLVSF